MNVGTYKYDVFLSYSSKDKDFVRRLDRMLRSIGLMTFFDEREIHWGGNIPSAIEEALDQSYHLIIVLSPDAVESEWVDMERCVNVFRTPGGKRRSILPLLRRDCAKIPAAIRILRYLPVRNNEEFQQAWPQIVAHLADTCNLHRQIHAKADGIEPIYKRKCIATICPMFGASRIYYTNLLSVIWREAAKRGYEMLVVPINDPNRKRRLISHFPLLPSISGIILITCQVEGSTWLEECAALDLPVVLLHDNIPEHKAKGYSVVSYIRPRLDAFCELVSILVNERECQNFSVVMVDPKNHSIREEKLAVIENAVLAQGLNFDHHKHVFYIKEYSYEAGIEVVNYIMERNPRTDAILSLADETAAGILRGLAQLELTGKVSVTGFDNVTIAEQHNITTVDQQLTATGERALLDLHSAITKVNFDEFRTGRYIQTNLVRRTSA